MIRLQQRNNRQLHLEVERRVAEREAAGSDGSGSGDGAESDSGPLLRQGATMGAKGPKKAKKKRHRKITRDVKNQLHGSIKDMFLHGVTASMLPSARAADPLAD